MGKWLSEWMTWSNGFYLAGLILTAILAIVSVKYRKLVKEVKDVAVKLNEAYADKKLTKAEKEGIMKEVLDVLKALLRLVL